MSEPQYSGGGYQPFQTGNSERVFVSGNMYADRPEGPWYRILSPAEAKELFEKWRGKQHDRP